MKSCIRVAFAALMVLFTTATPALAAKTFTIAPFTVNGPSAYKYLEQSIPQMFASRLFWKGQFEPAAKTGTAQKLTPADEAAAEKARAAAGADYVIWGSVTVLGDNCSVDVRVRDGEGKTWPLSRESNINRLIPDLRQLSDAVNAEVFQVPQARPVARSQQAEPVNQMNPGLVRNETGGGEVYINPQFRYAGSNADESRLRSQTLPYASAGMEVCDADGDGKKEVFLVAEKRLYAYRFNAENQLDPLGVTELPASQEALSIRSMDIDNTGRPKLILNAKDESEDLIARIYSFDGKNFKEEVRARGYYLSVVDMPPLFRPALVAQRANPPRLFTPGVWQASVLNGELKLGGRLNLPKDFNVFNFAYIPAGMDNRDTTKLVMLGEDERLRLYSEKGTRMFSTEDKYSGASVGIYVDAGMPGMGKEHVIIGETYYVPMRMLAVDLDRDGNYELVVNKPITTAGLIFGNYRSFPQSEIHSLQWDGVGLGLVWKTRRIKGSVVDYAITDGNNDGILDLVVCVNTHPGALGAAARRTIVLVYPLDLSKADPDTRPMVSE